MKKITLNRKIFVGIDIIIILFCTLGVYQIIQKANIPFEVQPIQSGIVVSDSMETNQKYFTKGDTIVSINGYNFRSGDEVELYLDGKQIGDNVDIEFIHHGNTLTQKVTLISYYSTLNNISVIIVASIFIILAMFVIQKCFEKNEAHLFHWLSLGVAIMITMTWGNYEVVPFVLGIISRIGLHLGFGFVTALLIHFSLIFPKEKKFSKKLVLTPLYLISTFFVVTLSVCFFLYISGP